MAKKESEADMQEQVKESAYKVWLAGLGALAVAGEEGKALFRSLVERGEDFEKKSMKEMDKVRGRMEDARSNAGMMWERVQTSFDEQVATALHRLGVPTRSEIANLTRRVEELTRSIEKMRTAPATPARPKKAPTVKTTEKAGGQ